MPKDDINIDENLTWFKTFMVLGPDYLNDNKKKKQALLPKEVVDLIINDKLYASIKADNTPAVKQLVALFEAKNTNEGDAEFGENILEFIIKSPEWTNNRALVDAYNTLKNWDILSGAKAFDAYENGYKKIIEFLASAKLRSGTDRVSILHIVLSQSLYKQYREIFKSLLTVRGIDVNAINLYRQTPLLYAAAHGDNESVALLLAVPGIDTTIIQHDGRTTAELFAKTGGHTEIVKMIQDHIKKQEASKQKAGEVAQLIKNHFKL